MPLAGRPGAAIVERSRWRRGATLALLALAAGAPRAALAYRPFDSTDAAVASTGDLELELGPTELVKQGADVSLAIPSLVLNWGVAEGTELVLEGRHFVRIGSAAVEQPRSRIEETYLSVKTVLREGCLQDRRGPSVATEIGALLPTVNGEPGVGAQGFLIASQRWTDLTVHLNGAVAWTRAHALGLFGGIILEGHDAWPVRPVAELFVEGEEHRPTIASGLVGAIWRASEGLSFDVAARRARAGDVTTTEIRAGLTWGFSVGFPRRRPS